MATCAKCGKEFPEWEMLSRSDGPTCQPCALANQVEEEGFKADDRLAYLPVVFGALGIVLICVPCIGPILATAFSAVALVTSRMARQRADALWLEDGDEGSIQSLRKMSRTATVLGAIGMTLCVLWWIAVIVSGVMGW